MTIYNLPSDITNLISDTLHGDIEYWKCKYNDVLDDIKLHNPEYLVEVCFCNDKYELTTGILNVRPATGNSDYHRLFRMSRFC